MDVESRFITNLQQLRHRINDACERASRNPDEVSILPVTKNHPHQAAEMAHRAGLLAVGENRVQEAVSKKALCQTPLRWELIGHLQSNKVRHALSCFDRIQSVDSLKLIQRLEAAVAEQARTFPILLQFNTGQDPAKFGADPKDANSLVDAVLASPHLRLEGLMTIAPLDENPAIARHTFEALRALRDSLSEHYGIPLPTLSMGMSDDLDEAVAAGSTMIRVGTALFGQR